MPVPGEHNAPVFDLPRPSQIHRYFTQLEHLFERAAISHDQHEMKFYTTFFVDPDLADLWEAFPEFTSPSSTFSNLKSALIGTYAGFGKYKPSDLHALIAATNSSKISSFSDLSDYHLRFQEISSDLITFGHLDTIGQTLAYPHGFPPTFWKLISQHLVIKFPDHCTIDPYPISDIFDATRFVIHLPASYVTTATPATSVSSAPCAPAPLSAPVTLVMSHSTSDSDFALPGHLPIDTAASHTSSALGATQATPPLPSVSLDVPIRPKFVAATARHQISLPALSEVSSPSLSPCWTTSKT